MVRGRVGVDGAKVSATHPASLLAAESRGRIRWFGFWQQLLVLVVIGTVFSLVSVTITAAVYKNNLQTRVSSVAEALDAQRVTGLQQAANDDDAKADYAYLKDHLARIKAVNADARFLYLMGQADDGSAYFLVDSEAEGSEGYSPRGQPYPEASPELKSIFEKGISLVEGPSHDSYGDWLSGLAPIVDEQSLGCRRSWGWTFRRTPTSSCCYWQGVCRCY